MERWSPYTYGKDNPIRFIDPDGMSDVDPKAPDKAFGSPMNTSEGWESWSYQSPQGGASGGAGGGNKKAGDGDKKYKDITPAGAPPGQDWDNTEDETKTEGDESAVPISAPSKPKYSNKTTTTSVTPSTGTGVLDKIQSILSGQTAPVFISSVSENVITNDGLVSSDGKTLTLKSTVTNTNVVLNDGKEVISAISRTQTTTTTYTILSGGLLITSNQSIGKAVTNNSPNLSPALINRVERAELVNQLNTAKAINANRQL